MVSLVWFSYFRPNLWFINYQNFFAAILGVILTRNLSSLYHFIYACDSSHSTLSENAIVYYGIIYCFGYISVWILLRSPQLWKKNPNFWQLKDHNPGGKHRNQRNYPIFWSTFFSSICLWHWLLYISNQSKCIFIWSPVRLILVCKTPEFLDKEYRFWQ